MGRMRIEVNLTKEDHIQMQVDHASRSKTLKYMIRILLVIGAVSLLLLPIIIIFETGNGQPFGPGAFGIPLVLAVVGLSSPILVKLINKVAAASLVTENSIESHCGLNIIELNEDRITRRMEKRYEEIDWSIIQRYVETRDHIYIYDSSVSNIIVPKRDLDRETIKELITFLERKLLE